jgi:hypothetical protein
MLDVNKLPESLKKLLNPQTPTGLKMLAIKGTVPLKPVEYLIFLYQMQFDGNEELRSLAEKAFAELPPKILIPAVSQNLPPEVFQKIATVHRSNNAVIEKLITNNAVSDETIEMIAGYADEKMLDIIARNQVRILRYPKIIKAIVENPNATASQKSMVVEFAIKSKIDLSKMGIDVNTGVNEQKRSSEISPVSEVQKAGEAIEAKEALTAPVEGSVAGTTQHETDSASRREELIKKYNIPREFYDESVPLPEEMEKKLVEELETMSEDKQMAIVEVGRHRIKQLMVRSPIASVAVAVVKHPDITPDDIYKIAQDRAAHTEAIKAICTNRDYIRVYNIKLKLALNPKTPVPMAMAFVRSLRLSDLKNIAKNNSVSKILQNTAKDIMKMHS